MSAEHTPADILSAGLLAAGQAIVVARIAESQPCDACALLAALDEYEQRCIGLVEATRTDRPEMDSWAGIAVHLARSHAIGQVQSELLWIERARQLIVAFASNQPHRQPLVPVNS